MGHFDDMKRVDAVEYDVEFKMDIQLKMNDMKECILSLQERVEKLEQLDIII